MLAPRTVKTLTALFFAMTLGTLLLMWMDVEPIRAPGTHLTALAASEETPLAVIAHTRKPISSKWQRIVIHSSVEGPSAVEGSHFIVDPRSAGDSLNVRATDCWQDQSESGHVAGSGHDWNKACIGICLSGDFSRTPPTPEQMQSLKKLVTDLQRRFGIPASRVYSYRDISSKSNSPGAAFPEKELAAALLP
jgi:hypothetical protein